MKPALFNVLCEIKEKTGRNENPTFGPFFFWLVKLLRLRLSCSSWDLYILGCEHYQGSPCLLSGKGNSSLTADFKQYVFFKCGPNSFCNWG